MRMAPGGNGTGTGGKDPVGRRWELYEAGD